MKSRPVVLVVETQASFQYMQPMLERMLNQPRLVHCKTHQEAMSYVASDEYADYIFADWDLGGYRFLEAVRSDLENHNTPIIIMSEDTNNKQIVLNAATSPGTFFLAKPFLEKGLVNKFEKALSAVERRRRNRINPFRAIVLAVLLEDGRQLDLQLVDISIDGCLFRMSLEMSKSLHVYQRARISLNIDEFAIEAWGEIYRIGHDRPIPDARDSVLVMLKFVGPDDEERQLIDLVDELARRW
jgi:CheY-like chemotaxis protein